MMKRLTFLCLVMLLSGSTLYAQEKALNDSVKITFSFVPENFPTSSQNYIEMSSTQLLSEPKFVFKAAGWLLQGLRYKSVGDQFKASPLFDLRGYDSRSFTDYSLHAKRNYLQLNAFQ